MHRRDYEVSESPVPPASLRSILANQRVDSDSSAGSDAVAIDLGGDYQDVLVLVGVWVAAPYVQTLAGQAANTTYKAFTEKIKSLLSDKRQQHTPWDLLVLRTPDGELTVEIPGNLPEDAHAALVRDFIALVLDEPDAQRLHLVWDQRTGTWTKADA
ncbi:hypothetical protein G5C51_05465 [Streptomyces sp. A7024]|uniref:Uncharacterized protein n=1 Tax=Streptomyces coryli TaxID=1128680 RepID=A0A6G4TTP5_9ACTN|nr:hypothetical protein [Streptomyces coryli]NGN63355.1 hypothetical protein [Streptomyces coryli]